MRRVAFQILSTTWLQHLIFWMLSITFVTSYFAISSEYSITDLIYSLCFHVCLIPMVYVLLRAIIPRFFETEKYILFALFLLANIGFAWSIHWIVFEYLVPLLLTSYYIVSFTDNTILIILFSIYTAVVTLLHFSKSWFRVNTLEKDKLNLELNSLKNQLNPHFLFNGLNGIYSLSIQNDPRAPEAILKLSDLLRYSLYEVSTKLVPIENELDIIKKYIDIQLIRFKPKRNVQIHINGNGTPNIVPMLLLPLVENAFKHGNLTKDNSFIKINCQYSDQYIEFECINSVATEKTNATKHSGIGLNSIQKLIEIYYQLNGQVVISDNTDIFAATIKLIIT